MITLLCEQWIVLHQKTDMFCFLFFSNYTGFIYAGEKKRILASDVLIQVGEVNLNLFHWHLFGDCFPVCHDCAGSPLFIVLNYGRGREKD